MADPTSMKHSISSLNTVVYYIYGAMTQHINEKLLQLKFLEISFLYTYLLQLCHEKNVVRITDYSFRLSIMIIDHDYDNGQCRSQPPSRGWA